MSEATLHNGPDYMLSDSAGLAPVLPAVPNTHGPEQGQPPHLVFPAAVEHVSYFESKDGDQWRMLVTADRRIDLRCGRLGWHNNLAPFLVPLMTMQHVLGKRPAAVRTAVGGTCAVVATVGDQKLGDVVCVVVDEKGMFAELNMPERLWIHACVMAAGLEDRLLSPKQLEGYVKAATKVITAQSAIHGPAGEDGHVHGPHCKH